jgi:two-component system response regulator QseB
MKILLAEDDPMLGASMEQGLELAGFVVDRVRDGHAASLALDHGHHDLLLLDLGMPRQDGLSLLKNLRASGRTLPVLIVTARDAVADRVAGLNLGADDYLSKPFDLDELIARVHALGRRVSGRGRPEMRLGALVLDPIRHEVCLDGQQLGLSQREFALLSILISQPGKVFSREQIEDGLYGWGEEIASNAVEVHLHNLRRKLGTGWIRNVRGVGYKLSEPVA